LEVRKWASGENIVTVLRAERRTNLFGLMMVYFVHRLLTHGINTPYYFEFIIYIYINTCTEHLLLFCAMKT